MATRAGQLAVLARGGGLLQVAHGAGTAIPQRGSGAPLWVGGVVGVVGVVVGVVGYLLSSLEVRVDAARFTVAFGPVGWPRRRIELVDVRDVAAITVEPSEWGGWGYRWIPWAHASAAVIRRGPGIVLVLADGRKFAVTVDDSVAGAKATASALNALGH
jgi:hypothetical protein